MKKAQVLMLSILALSLLLYLGPYAYAEDNPFVETYEYPDPEAVTDYFPTCPVTVGIKTKSAHVPYDVIVVEPDGTEYTIATVTDSAWHYFSYYCTETGWWTAKAGSETIPFGVGPFQVVPEFPFGTVMAMTAFFGAFALKRLRQRPCR